MARTHRVTHPILGVVSWAELKSARPDRSCSWCFKDLRGTGKFTRCGDPGCVRSITNLISWSVCARRILHRDARMCVLCGRPASEVDHIVPVSLGGTGDPANLRSLCREHHKEETRRLRREGKAFIATRGEHG